MRELLLLLRGRRTSWAGLWPELLTLGLHGRAEIMIERKRVTLSSRMLRFVQDSIECLGVRVTAARVHGLQNEDGTSKMSCVSRVICACK